MTRVSPRLVRRTQDDTAQDETAQDDTAQDDTAADDTAQDGTAGDETVRQAPVAPSPDSKVASEPKEHPFVDDPASSDNPFADAFIDDAFFSITTAVAVSDKASRFPDVAVDSDGAAWVVWCQQVGNDDGDTNEQVVVRRFDERGAGRQVAVSETPGRVLQPCIVTLAHGSMRIFWISRNDDKWQLLTRSFRGRDFASEAVVAESADGLFNPRAAIDAAGTCWVVCERVPGRDEGRGDMADSGASTDVVAFRQAKNTWIEEALETLDGDCYRPDVSLGPDNALWVAYDCYESGRYRVAIQSIPGSAPRPAVAEEQEGDEEPQSQRGLSPIIVADDGYNNLHPALTCDGGGNLWIAYASNRNDARRDPAWLTKWSYVARFDGDKLFVPAGPRPDVDPYDEEVYQGWEFPAIAVASTADGEESIVVTGQSAHSLRAQVYQGDEWSAAHTVVEQKWGSWKPRCRMASGGPDAEVIYMASMGLSGAQVQRLDVKTLEDSDPQDQRAVSNSGDAEEMHPRDSASPIVVPAPRLLPARPVPSRGLIAGVYPRASRPEISGSDGTNYGVYFGDLHAHSVYGDAAGDVDELYHRYRDLYGYDFAALTEHDYLDGITLSESELELLWNHAKRVSEDDAFVAWFGYEWTSPAIAVHAANGTPVGEGHRHVLYPDDSGPLIAYGTEETNTGAGLLAALKDTRALVVPHHTGWSGTNWDAHDKQLQRVVEIVSAHGRFEYAGNRPIPYRRDHVHTDKFVLAALDRGYKLGFVGGSDSHGLRWHGIEMEGRAAHIKEGTYVGWKEDAYRGGMTAVLAESLTRESLFQAIYNRRCYATSGVPIVVDFRIDDRLMGSELVASGSAPRITATVNGTAPIRSIEVVRSGHVFGGLDARVGEGLMSMQFAMDDTMITPGESHYYYLRVLQEDGEMAWSSPIWVEMR